MCVIYVGGDNDFNVQAMITRLMWTIWTSLSAVRKRPLNLITHSLTYRDFKDNEVQKAEEFISNMKNFFEMIVAVCAESIPIASIILPLSDKTLKMCQVT